MNIEEDPDHKNILEKMEWFIIKQSVDLFPHAWLLKKLEFYSY